MCSFKGLGHCNLEVFGSMGGGKGGPRPTPPSLLHRELECSWMVEPVGYLGNGCASGADMGLTLLENRNRNNNNLTYFYCFK